MTPTEMALLRQQMGQSQTPQRNQGGWGGGHMGGGFTPPPMPAMRPAEPPMPSMDNPMARQLQDRGGPNSSAMSRLFPSMGMPNGVPSNIPTTPMAAGDHAGQFSNGQRDLPGMRAMGK